MGLFDFLKKNEFDKITKLNQEKEALNQQLRRYQGIIDIEKEVEQKREEFKQIIFDKSVEIAGQKLQSKELKANYQSSLETYKKLRKELSVFESRLDLIEFGVYEPIYDFDKSEDYRQEQDKIIDKQKQMIENDTAAICNKNWTVGDSEAKGRAVVNRYKKLMLRAFNGESDVLITKVKWNNITQIKERMSKVYSAINKLGEGFEVYINTKYRDLKISELVLEYEYQAKKQAEKEKMKAIQDELREEEKAKRDFEKAQKEAEKESLSYHKALEKVRKEYQQANGIDAEQLKAQIAKLEQDLEESQAKKERALSMAQQTKRGYVYIISNIGAFGEDVFKIGMTRRLEPLDRVRELGDASVPFQFDVHALIYSDEARTLEYELHKAFSEKKVNMLNYRREFFRVSLDEIETKIKELGFEAEFTLLPEAMEFRETLAMLQRQKNPEEIKTLDQVIAEDFPDLLSNIDD